jgi:hypothetical protein
MSAGSETSAQTGLIFRVVGFFGARAMFIPGKFSVRHSRGGGGFTPENLPRE